MSDYSEICLKTFLKDQKKLFDEPVAENLEEAEAFLEECMAVVVHSLDEVREYFEEEGADIDGMTREELEEASEVFPLPDGTYLIVEGYQELISLRKETSGEAAVYSTAAFPTASLIASSMIWDV